jgi:23S rRNA (guanosine2251-2'-O)-methyltransferase
MPRDDLVYGFHSAEEVLSSRPRQVNHIWTSSSASSSRLKHLISQARSERIPVRVVDREALRRLTGTNHHQDIVLEISPYRYSDADDLLADVRSDSLYCILDEIQDVTNLAALIRTMEGAGVQGVFLPERRSAAVTGTTYRLSAGALQHIKIARVGNLAQLIDRMHEKEIRVICADAGASKLWYEVDYSGPVAVLVGNEFKGVRQLLKQKSDERVRVPMLGKVKSLNVHVAAAILLYEVIRRRS